MELEFQHLKSLYKRKLVALDHRIHRPALACFSNLFLSTLVKYGSDDFPD